MLVLKISLRIIFKFISVRVTVKRYEGETHTICRMDLFSALALELWTLTENIKYYYALFVYYTRAILLKHLAIVWTLHLFYKISDLNSLCLCSISVHLSK